jgi:hypothetical protein
MDLLLKQKSLWHSTSMCAVTSLLLLSNAARGMGPPTPEVNGTLGEIEGVRVLRVWGTPQERGFAHGYLIGKDAVGLLNGFIASGAFMDVEGYENEVLPRLGSLDVPPEFEAELRGILSGIEAKVGGPVTVSILGRPLRYEDLVAGNSMGDALRTGCSSFTAWGPMTEDGHTLAGRNMDWATCPALEGTQVVMVHVAQPDSKKLGWVSIQWPGLIGCTTGMNSEGVTVASHDSNTPNPGTKRGFTPMALLYREAIESARAETAFDDISSVLGKRFTITGNNMMVARPFERTGLGAVVFEHDADLAKGRGVTVRESRDSETFLVCTNHSRKRYDPMPCSRYLSLSDELKKIAQESGEGRLTTKRAWDMLRRVSIDGFLTHHSAVFEPNRRLMHIALSRGRQSAPRCKVVTLDVQKLLEGDYPGGK